MFLVGRIGKPCGLWVGLCVRSLSVSQRERHGQFFFAREGFVNNGFGATKLYCYWGGSLDFNFLDSPHISF